MLPDTRSPGQPALAPAWVWLPALATLLALAAALTWFPLLRSFADLQVNHNEGWNAARQALAANRVPLYGAPPLQDFTNYPSLSFHLVGAAGRLVGDVNLAGRLLSLVSLAGVVGLAAGICRSLGTGWLPALYAGLGFLVWLAVYHENRIGMNDPQMFALLLQMAGLAAFLRRGAGTGAVIASALFFAVALFVKHNLVAIPLAVGLALVLARRWRDLLVWAGSGAALALLLLGATLAVDGPYLMAHLLAPRSFSAQRAFWKAAAYVVPYQVFLGLAAAAAMHGFRRGGAAGWRVLGLAWVAATAIGVAGVGVRGVDQNVLHDSMVLATMLTALALSALAALPALRGAVAVLALASLLGIAMEAPGKLKAELADWRTLRQDEAEFRAGVALLRGLDGPVLCEDPLLCHAAGRPNAVNPGFVGDQVRLGRRPLCDLLGPIERGGLAALTLSGSVIGEATDESRLPAEVLAVLRTRWRIGLAARQFLVLLPVPEAVARPGRCPAV